MSVLDILLPSPPSTSHRDRIPIPQPTKPGASTPHDSPASFLPSSGTGTRKRVEFSSWPDARVDPSSDPASESSILRALPRSKDCHSMVRSILKPYSESEVLKFGLDGTSNARLAITMDSIIEQLSNNDKFSSVDAYQSLAQLIKTYDEVPEDSDTRSNVVTLLKYVKRDLATQDQNLTAPVDMNLATQALKVSVIFVWSEHLSPLLTDDFRIFITDRAINALADHTAPKVVIVHYMHLLATQNFRSIMFTSGTRTGKLLEAMREVTNHVQGKGVMSERLLVYQKLIEQAKPVMKAKAGLWIKEVLMGLTSKVKDIQEKAMSVCSKICASFPMSSQISQATREALVTIIKDRTLNAMITQRLIHMIAAKDEAVQVPQIWALVMLMCNSMDSRLESWSYTKEWLKVLQRCFNCSDVNVRIQAFPAWNRFIYITRPHEASDSMLSMLAKPIVAQIERTSTHASGKGTRPAAVSSYCTLLYYAFRPAANFKQYTRSWNEYIVKISTSQFLSRSTANADLCCRTLMALLWRDSSASRIWNENRAHENRPVDPEELPAIDCKWIRSKAGPILDIFRLLFQYSAWGPSIQHSDQAFVAKAWRHFMKAIRESASKEVKQSNDTKKAMACIVEFLNEAFEPNQTNNDDGTMDVNQVVHFNFNTQVACNIAAAELGLKAVVDAMDFTNHQHNPIVLEELLRLASQPVHTEDIQELGRQKRNVDADLHVTPAMRTCLRLLDNELQQSYAESQLTEERFTKMLRVAATSLHSISDGASLQCIQLLERSLLVVIEDQAGIHDLFMNNTDLTKAWLMFSDALANKLTSIPVQQYMELDNLLAAVITSSNSWVQDQIQPLRSKIWSRQEVVYGKMLQKAMISDQGKYHTSLPGFTTYTTTKKLQDQMAITVDEDLSSELPATVEETLLEATTLTETLAGNMQESREGMIAGQLLLPADDDDDDSEKLASPRKDKISAARVRSRHDDSQVQFVPITSSPPNTAEIESQFLTERQKEVREQQRKEPAVTFADLRSSPKTRTHRSSRAPSVDCEMARKVAAMEDTPATPTLSRQAENLDDEVLPSPTPKSRQQRLRIAEIEIPSSPPSVAGNPDDVPQDIASSPSKAANLNEGDMVSLEVAQQEFEVIAEEFSMSKSGKKNILLEKLRGQRKSGRNVVDHRMENIDMVDVIGNGHVATGQDSQQDKATTSKQIDTMFETDDPIIFENHQTDSDELDEASASQLSQDLDWHLKREVRAATTSDHNDEVHQTTMKKRKRIVNGYVGCDRKRRRKQISPQSSDVSEAHDEADENETVIQDTDVEDCVIVKTRTNQSPAIRHTLTSTPISRREHDSTSVSSTGRRKRGKSRKSRTSPRPIVDNESQALLGHDNSVTEKTNETGEADMDFHTPTPARVRHEVCSEPAAHQQKPAAEIIDTSPIPQQAHTKDIMMALQAALHGLKKNQQADIDLRAIDDLCFQIRYQAQENAHRRDHA